MVEKMIKELMNQVDYSGETDLKERLRAQLFGSPIRAFPGRKPLTDDVLEQVYAAGQTTPGKNDARNDLNHGSGEREP